MRRRKCRPAHGIEVTRRWSLIGLRQRLIQPIINSRISETACADFAMSPRASGVSELHHGLVAGKVVEELLGLPWKNRSFSASQTSVGVG
jgi:hypothetical protein